MKKNDNQEGIRERDLSRLDRIRLIELIVEQSRKIESLESELENANKRLDARCIRLDIEKIGTSEDLSRALRAALKEVEGTVGAE